MRDLIPGLDSVLDATLDRYIVLATARITADEWGPVWEQAVALLAGHLYQRTLRTPGGGPGGITSKSTGPLSEGYGGASGGGDDLATTPAGLDFVALRRTHVCGPRVI